MWDSVTQDHLVLGITPSMTRRSLDRVACTTLRVATSVLGEGTRVQTTRLEEEVHFIPTTWTCKCFSESRRDVLILVMRPIKDGWLGGSTWPWYRITT